MSEKQCQSCSEVKPISEYYKPSDSLCKACRRDGKTKGKIKENKDLAMQGLCRCMDCEVIKPETDFTKRGYRCKPCTQMERVRKLQQKNPDYVLQEKKSLTPSIPGNKVCSGCNVEMLKEEFYKNIEAIDGLMHSCKSCTKVRASKHYKENKELINERARQERKNLRETNPEEYERMLACERERFHKRDKDECNEKSRQWARNNPEKSRVIKERWASNNLDKIRERTKSYRENNKARYAFLANQRRARKLRATPTWLTNEEHEDIFAYFVVREFFNTSMNDTYEVDHIVPLQGRGVCGLHVPWNLRVIPKAINSSKSNKLIPQLSLYLGAEYYRTTGKEFNENNMF